MNGLLSVVVPCRDEEAVLPGALSGMWNELEKLEVPFEIVICENGSSDGTFATARQLQAVYPELRVERIALQDKGLALRQAIAAADGATLVFFDVEYWNVDFVRQGLRQLQSCDVVIGSKSLAGAGDERPLLRRTITQVYNAFLRTFFGLRGTDTHGLMIFKREVLSRILPLCVTRQFIFETELVLRAQRMGFKVVEIPVHVRELRPHRVASLLKRIPGVLWNLTKLRCVLK